MSQQQSTYLNWVALLLRCHLIMTGMKIDLTLFSQRDDGAKDSVMLRDCTTS